MTNHVKHMRVTVEGKPYEVTVEILSGNGNGGAHGPDPHAEEAARPARVHPLVVTPPPAASSGPVPDGAVLCPLAGTVASVEARPGQPVVAGEALVHIEAMKMKTAIRASRPGVVREVRVREGESVAEGAVLLVLG